MFDISGFFVFEFVDHETANTVRNQHRTFSG
jgi:hypothetical protein